MAVASPPFALAHVAPIPFSFALRGTVKVQVRFYTDASGSPSAVIAEGTGGRDVVVTTAAYVTSTEGDYTDPALDTGYNNGTLALVGGEWAEFEFADGDNQASFACSGGSDPGGAVSYRVILSISMEVP